MTWINARGRQAHAIYTSCDNTATIPIHHSFSSREVPLTFPWYRGEEEEVVTFSFLLHCSAQDLFLLKFPLSGFIGGDGLLLWSFKHKIVHKYSFRSNIISVHLKSFKHKIVHKNHFCICSLKNQSNLLCVHRFFCSLIKRSNIVSVLQPYLFSFKIV